MTATLEQQELARTGEPLTAQDMRLRVNRMQEVMKAVMKDGVHYGIIPGTDKPTLYKAGAEVALVTFRVAALVKSTEDIGTPGEEVRYRVVMQGAHQITGDVLGEGAGECSSNEEKYKWRRPVHENEYNAADPERRREKFTKKGEVWKQVRTEPADVANTILKMAVKRALVAMTLVVTAASDVFTQDIEDVPEELRENVTEKKAAAAVVRQPERVDTPSTTSNGAGKPEPAAAAAALDPAATYILKKLWKPNATKDYHFLELQGANGQVHTAHTWDSEVADAFASKIGKRIRVEGKMSTFDRAPFQIKKAFLTVDREPGAEG
jgi:hypothetical protein